MWAYVLNPTSGQRTVEMTLMQITSSSGLSASIYFLILRNGIKFHVVYEFEDDLFYVRGPWLHRVGPVVFAAAARGRAASVLPTSVRMEVQVEFVGKAG